jgi:hypothetical protein
MRIQIKETEKNSGHHNMDLEPDLSQFLGIKKKKNTSGIKCFGFSFVSCLFRSSRLLKFGSTQHGFGTRSLAIFENQEEKF